MNTDQIYSREHPSPRYTELTRLYGEMHTGYDADQKGAPEQIFNGFSLIPHVEVIKAMIDRSGARTVLDYGSGKGLQYKIVDIEMPDGRKFANVVEYWGVDRVVCFDPGVPEFNEFPTARFNGVVSTDVLEHCPEEDLPWILGEMISKAERFIFATVALYPAVKIMPNGENAHCTLRSPDWWRALIEDVMVGRPDLAYRFELHWTHATGAAPDARPPEVIEKAIAAAAA